RAGERLRRSGRRFLGDLRSGARTALSGGGDRRPGPPVAARLVRGNPGTARSGLRGASRRSVAGRGRHPRARDVAGRRSGSGGSFDADLVRIARAGSESGPDARRRSRGERRLPLPRYFARPGDVFFLTKRTAPVLAPGALEEYETTDFSGRVVLLQERILYSFYATPALAIGRLQHTTT